MEKLNFHKASKFAQYVVWKHCIDTSSKQDFALMQLIDDGVQKGIGDHLLFNAVRGTTPDNFEEKYQALKEICEQAQVVH